MSKSFRGNNKDYLKEKYLRERQKRAKRRVEEDKKSQSKERDDDDYGRRDIYR